MWEGVGDRTELQHIDPHSIGHNRVSFPFSWATQPGPFSTASYLQLFWSPTAQSGPFCPGAVFSTASFPTDLISKLTDFLSSPSYIIVQHPPSSCGRHNRTHSTRPQSRLYSDIPWDDAPVIYIGAFPILTARPGRRSIYNTRRHTQC